MKRIALAWIGIIVACCCAIASEKQLAPTGLMCELLSKRDLAGAQDVTGIDNPKPQLGWIVPLTKPNDRQTAYQILVASSQDLLDRNQGDVWDSGKVDSSASLSVEFAGKPLAANTNYFWKVRTWNHDDAPSTWSASQIFRTGSNLDRYKTPTFEPLPREIAAVKVESTGPHSYFIDFGQAAFGFLRLNIDVPAAEQTLTVRFGEKLKSPNEIDRKPGGTIRYSEAKVELSPKKKSYDVHPQADKRNTTGAAIKLPAATGVLTPFRYVEIEDCPVELITANVRQVMVAYPFDEQAAQFSCSDERLNKIWELCKHTIEATTFAGTYIDGDRERIPYEADAYINQIDHYVLDREYALARHSHEYLLEHPTWPTEWKFHSIFMAWADYLYTGNCESLAHNYASLQKKTLQDRARPDGLLGSNKQQVSHDDIVDWPTGERDGFVHTPVNAVVNAFYYRSLVLMGQIAEALGKTDDAAHYKAMAQQVYDAFNKMFFNAQRGVYVDGEGTDHASLHTNMFALDFGLVPQEHQATVVDFIKTRGMACSVYGAQYLLEALYEAGQADYACQLMTDPGPRGWLHMLDLGSTMTLEAWDMQFKPNLDWNHAWGAAPANIISRYLIGVRPVAPGFEKVMIQPQLGPLKWAEATVPTIRGPIHVRIDKAEHGGMTLQVSLPANMTARVGLPASGKSEQMLVNGKPQKGTLEDSTLWIDDVGSGENKFQLSP
ncbi:MAG TPA: family 78 glycoside hydrolase catalytic domain [Pirellulales bacterium]|jgi:hypothetical protein|nr:family 78 glycoside hydrolase catalytic domain [Pirellulales bacterium]